jgi:hypothetical protein
MGQAFQRRNLAASRYKADSRLLKVKRPQSSHATIKLMNSHDKLSEQRARSHEFKATGYPSRLSDNYQRASFCLTSYEAENEAKSRKALL